MNSIMDSFIHLLTHGSQHVQEAVAPNIWVKLLKTLVTLENTDSFFEIPRSERVEEVFKVLYFACIRANENLGTYYFLRVFLVLVRKSDNNILYLSS